MIKQAKIFWFTILLLGVACQPTEPAAPEPTTAVFITTTPAPPPTATALPPTEAAAPPPTITPTAVSMPPTPTVTNAPSATVETIIINSIDPLPVGDMHTFGGSLTSAAVVDEQTMLVAIGNRLIALDISNPAQPELLLAAEEAGLSLPGIIRTIIVQENRAFVAAGQRLFLLDISNSAQPVIKTQLRFEAAIQMAHLAADHLYLAVGNHAAIVEISNDSLEKTADILPPKRPFGFAVSPDNYLFLAYAGGLLIFDVDNPTEPIEKNHLIDMTLSGPLLLNGQTLYAGGQALHSFDVADPTVPELVSEEFTPGPAPDVLALGADGYLFGTSTFCEFGFCFGSLNIFDIADESNPIRLNLGESEATSLGHFSSTLELQDDWLFLGDANGLRLVDVQNPVEPQLIGRFSTFGSIQHVGFTPDGNTALVTGAAGDGVTVLDVRNSAAWQTLSNVPFDWAGQPVPLANGMAVTGWNNGLLLLDVTTPTDPITLSESDYNRLNGTPDSVLPWDDTILALNLSQGLVLLDSSDPRQLREIGRLSWTYDEYSMRHIARLENFLVASGNNNQEPISTELRLFDLSDLANPQPVADLRLPGRGGALALAESIAYVAWWEQQCYTSDCDGGLAVIDLSDRSNPQFLRSIALPSIRDLLVQNGRLFVASGTAVWQFDLADPANPQPLGNIDLNLTPYDIALEQGTLHVATGAGGLVSIKLP